MAEIKKKKSVKREGLESKPRKKVTKRVVSKTVEKRAVPETKPTKEKVSEFISSYKFLYTTFGILLLIVIILACFVFIKGKEGSTSTSNIVFSILEKNTHNYIDLDLESLVGKEYILKVTNFRKNKVNTKGAKYTITILNDTDVEIEVLKENEGENLITDQKQTVIEGETFSKTKKESVLYYIKVKNSDGLIKGDKTRIEIES